MKHRMCEHRLILPDGDPVAARLFCSAAVCSAADVCSVAVHLSQRKSTARPASETSIPDLWPLHPARDGSSDSCPLIGHVVHHSSQSQRTEHLKWLVTMTLGVTDQCYDWALR